ncbi:imm11 family protein [Ramlibacter humi]|uniref:Immunity MXAN-0049 protein domain-containing protein n=1 Tax=Ramlibacter humi TaxID=2530451 RepID=A0A4Z0CDR0_9BURK|nr:DUF1629 domain-containing protein [Ramlibacter humi]TFZ08369.1 hypothetical protein EZ216_04225 [Ramlibacter humi]
MDYFVLTTSAQAGGVINDYPQGSPAIWKFGEGLRMAHEFPLHAEVCFSPLFPTFDKLYDFQSTTLSTPVVSGRVRRVIDSLSIHNAELLPVVLKNHRGEDVPGEYALLNLIGAENAIDMQGSDYKMNHIDKEQIGRIKKLRLQKDAISADAKMFRCHRMRRLTLIREDVAAAFHDAGLTGFRTYRAEGWNGLEI